ncbi:hypothetical protein CBS101457_006820 [Exobasidium rhododendri]|nr:hypothetical protein CBS101457_006820 [Exobasidium rhododendri]
MGAPRPSVDADTTANGKAKDSAPENYLSTDSTQARRQRKLLDGLNACGIQKMLDIPKIAIVGSQSAGKSSILEITFPRAAGTCTRCPSEVRLFQRDEDWNCKISLRFEHDKDGKPLNDVVIVPFGDAITDSDQVQHRLIQAQKAILNPAKPVESFLAEDGKAVEGNNSTIPNEIQFSENVICIDVKGRNVRDLSLMDLPGLIANVGENENKGNIDLVKNSIVKAIKKPNCVILLVITMSEDYQTQPGVTLAKEADPHGKRTLGVLTKPDRVEEGVFQNWKPILEGTEQKLLHGYYVVKNPDPTQLSKLTHKQAREHEKNFFHQKKWSSLGSKVTSRLGSAKLAGRLSSLLEQIIKISIPDIVKGVIAMHQEVKNELDSLPKQVEEGRMVSHLNTMLRAFNEDFQWASLADQEENSLADDIYTFTNQFWLDMLDHRPRFLPLSGAELTSLRNAPANQEIRGLAKIKETRDYLFEEDKEDLKARNIHPVEKSQTSGSDRKLLETLEQEDYTAVANYTSTKKIFPSAIAIQRFTLSDIKKVRMRATRDMLPNNIPWSVKEKLIRLCTQNWPDITFETLKKIEARTAKESELLIKQHFSRFQVGGLEYAVQYVGFFYTDQG